MAVVARVELPSVAQMAKRPASQFHIDFARLGVTKDMRRELFVKPFEMNRRCSDTPIIGLCIPFFLIDRNIGDPPNEFRVAANVANKLVKLLGVVRNEDLL